MLTIVDGSLSKLKQEMDLWKKAQQDNVRAVKKEFKGKHNLHDKVYQAERHVERFSYSKRQPVRVENIIINYKMYEAFLKKLKSIPFTEKVEEGKVVITYQSKATKGKLELFDMSDTYNNLNHIPTAVLKDVGL